MSLAIVRALMDVTEGPTMLISLATVFEVSQAKNIGRNQGIANSTFPFIGIGLGAIIVTQLESHFKDITEKIIMAGTIIHLLPTMSEIDPKSHPYIPQLKANTPVNI